MYKCKRFNKACSEPMPEQSVCYTNPVTELKFVPVKEGSIVTKKLQSVETKVSENFKHFKYDDFRLENLQAAGVELREMSLGVDVDNVAEQINNLGEQVSRADEKIAKASKSTEN